jgi:hypothetical protein
MRVVREKRTARVKRIIVRPYEGRGEDMINLANGSKRAKSGEVSGMFIVGMNEREVRGLRCLVRNDKKGDEVGEGEGEGERRWVFKNEGRRGMRG